MEKTCRAGREEEKMEMKKKKKKKLSSESTKGWRGNKIRAK